MLSVCLFLVCALGCCANIDCSYNLVTMVFQRATVSSSETALLCGPIYNGKCLLYSLRRTLMRLLCAGNGLRTERNIWPSARRPKSNLSLEPFPKTCTRRQRTRTTRESSTSFSSQVRRNGRSKASSSISFSSLQRMTRYVMSFVVATYCLIIRQAFELVEKAPFRALLRFQRPQMKDSQMVHKTKLREWILTKAQDLEDRLRKYFKVGTYL